MIPVKSGHAIAKCNTHFRNGKPVHPVVQRQVNVIVVVNFPPEPAVQIIKMNGGISDHFLFGQREEEVCIRSPASHQISKVVCANPALNR